MIEPMQRPTKRPRRTIYYSMPTPCMSMFDASEDVLFPKREHPESPLPHEMRMAALASIAAVCRTVITHTERWGNPESDTPSTWSCVAWEKRRHAEVVLALVTVPTADLAALRVALDKWRSYGL